MLMFKITTGWKRLKCIFVSSEWEVQPIVSTLSSVDNYEAKRWSDDWSTRKTSVGKVI